MSSKTSRIQFLIMNNELKVFSAITVSILTRQVNDGDVPCVNNSVVFGNRIYLQRNFSSPFNLAKNKKYIYISLESVLYIPCFIVHYKNYP